MKRALARGGIDFDAAAMFGDDAVADAQAQAGAFALRLGGEERVENLVAGTSAGMPWPWSATSMRTPLCARPPALLIVTAPPALEASMALAKRFIITWLIFAGQHATAGSGCRSPVDLHLFPLGPAEDDVDRGFDPRIEIDFVQVAFVEPGRNRAGRGRSAESGEAPRASG